MGGSQLLIEYVFDLANLLCERLTATFMSVYSKRKYVLQFVYKPSQKSHRQFIRSTILHENRF